MLSSQSSINSEVETEKPLQELAVPDLASDQGVADTSIDVASGMKDLSDLLDGSWLLYIQSLIDALPEPLPEVVIECSEDAPVDQVNDQLGHQKPQTQTSFPPEEALDETGVSVEATAVVAEDVAEDVAGDVGVDTVVKSDGPQDVDFNSDSSDAVGATETTVEETASEVVGAEKEMSEEALIEELDPEVDPDVDFGDNSFLQIFSLNGHANDEKLVIFGDERDEEIANWADQREIHCLLFTIGESKFAAPLITLGHIFEINAASKSKGSIYRVPTLPDWVRGHFQDNNFSSLVLDGYRTLLLNEEFHSNPEHVLTFGGGRWGVTCDEVSRAIWVDKEDVQWRKDRSHRPWSCGILVKEMCVLIDIPLLSRTLQFNQK